MIIKLPIINNNKVVYTLFRLEKQNNYFLLSILEDSNITNDNFFNCNLITSETGSISGGYTCVDSIDISLIKTLSCNNINGISYLNLYFPMKLFIIDNQIFSIYFFMIVLTSNFKNKLDFFYNLNEILKNKFNFNIINFENLVKYENEIFEIIDDEYKHFINNKKYNKEFWEMINLLLNVSGFVLWKSISHTNFIEHEKNIKKSKIIKKINQINNNLKNISFSINYSNNYTIHEHINNINNRPLKINEISKDNNYFLQLSERKIIYIKVIDINFNLIKINCFNNLLLFDKYKWYAYPIDTKLNINTIYLKLFNSYDVIKIIINKYNSKLDNVIIDNIINYFINNQYKSNLFSFILENNVNNFSEGLEGSNFQNINDIILEQTEIELLKSNSFSDEYFINICSKYDNSIKVFEALILNYTFPIKYNKKEIDKNFDYILYYSLLNINKIMSNKEKDKYVIVNNLNVLLPNKIKLIYFNIIKIFYQFKNNISHNLIYDNVLINFLKIFFSSKTLTLDLLEKIVDASKIDNFKHNLFLNFIIIDVLSKLSWTNINKRLNYLQILYNNKEYLFYYNKLNKNLFLDNYDNRIKSILINPYEMFKYLRRESDFIKWIYFLENKCSDLYIVPISLCSNDFVILGKIIYNLINIKDQTFDDKYYARLLEIGINNPKIILNNYRINLKIKENFGFLKCNINLGILAKHLSNNKNNIIKFNDDNEKSEIELLKKDLEIITRKYYKYKKKYNSLIK